MSEKQSNQLATAQDAEEKNSLFDFIYFDHKRVGALLAQLGDHGQLTAMSINEGMSEAQKDHDQAQGGLKFGLSVNYRQSHEINSARNKSATSTYDPHWLNALILLDYLQESFGNDLKRPLSDSRLGDFVQLSGKLSICDAKMLKALWNNNKLRSKILSGLGSIKKDEKDSIDLSFEFLKIAPETICGSLNAPSQEGWFTLNEDNLVLSTGEIYLKHDYIIDGDWHIIGVLDGKPKAAFPEITIDPTEDVNIVSRIMPAVANMAKMVMGKPNNAYGILPLMIFREVG